MNSTAMPLTNYSASVRSEALRGRDDVRSNRSIGTLAFYGEQTTATRSIKHINTNDSWPTILLMEIASASRSLT